jgi:SAM-dependent methyltransferase
MELYKTYLKLWKEGRICAGFSPRLPDYGIRIWLELLEKSLPYQKGATFLDVGAGDGRLSLLLLRAFSPRGMAIEIQTNKDVWAGILQDYKEFELYDGLLQEAFVGSHKNKKFNFVLLAEVFEHIPPQDVSAFLKALHDVLAPGGHIFLTTPNRVVQGPAELTPIWYERTPYGHYKHYSYAELKNIFDQAGFHVVWHRFECHPFKRYVYNKLFYPISRWDARFLNSLKIPRMLRVFYSAVSWLPLQLIKTFFWFLALIVYIIEKTFTSEKNGATIVMCIMQKT